MSMTISIDDDLKREFSDVCREIGLSPSTAIGVFARAVVRERCIPFTLSAGKRSDAQDAAASDDEHEEDGNLTGLVDVSSRNMLSREDSKVLRAVWAKA